MQPELISTPVDLEQSVAANSRSRLDRFRSGVWRGLGLAIVGSLTLLYVGSMTGYLVVTVGELPQLVELWYWTYENLRSSLLPFAVVLVWFALTLLALRRCLTTVPADYDVVYQLDRRCDVLIGLFFGIGVIWTAIGMRSALIGALGGLDAQSAARMGAFGVLQALVEQGILLALSTTIVGGIGGYLLRVLKLLLVGSRLDRFYAGLNAQQNKAVLDRLQAIEDAVLDLAPAAKSTDRAEPSREST